MRLEDVRPHMVLNYGFTRFHVTEAMQKMLGGKRTDYDAIASRMLAKARKEGLVKFPDGRPSSKYYFFTKPKDA
jgi:hypothetical protein